MLKKFSTKPIRLSQASKKKNNKENVSEKETTEDYDVFNPSSEIQRPIEVFHFPWLALFIAIIFGFGGGMASHYFFTNLQTIGGGEQKVIIDKNEEVTVTSEERIAQVSEKVSPVVINFYKKSDDLGGPYYQDENSYGTGFVVTSDGWIVTTKSVTNRIDDDEFLVLTQDYKIYTVEETVEDPISDAVFMKLNTKDLPVSKLGDITKMNSGALVYGFIAAYPTPRVASLHIADLQTSVLEDVVASTEKIGHFVSVREGYHSSLFGSPIVNLSGEIIAIVVNNSTALPVEYLKTAISDLGKKDKIERANFGVHYINLAKYPKVDPESDEMRDKGAYLSGWQNLLAVEKGSPADKAGLQVGDIITMVEDEIVNGRKTLGQIVQDYDPGDEVQMTIIRDEKEKIVEVKFGTVK